MRVGALILWDGRPGVMRTKLSVFLLSTACLVLGSLPVSAATVVLGINTAAQDCYRAAASEDAGGIPVCNVALKQDLSARDRAATLINRGALRFVQKNYQAAIEDSEVAIKTYPKLGEAYLNRGAAMRELGDPALAIKSLDESISMGFGRLQLAYFDRGMAKEDMGDVKGAYQDYKKALELAPDFTLAAEQLKRFRVVGA